MRNLILAALFLTLGCTLASAQGLGSFSGTVTDPSGARVPSATVTVTETGTGFKRAMTTGADGHFVLPDLRPSGYNLTVEASGFRGVNRTGLTLQADESATINVTLELGSVAESVTVGANATQVDTTTQTLRQVVDSARMVDMPLNGRNAASLTSLVAGAVNAPPSQADQGKSKSIPVVVAISTNGTRQNMVSYKLDGAENIDNLSNVNAPFPAPDALQEFSVQTSNYSAEFGQSAGGVVNVVTKSGTNEFHGDVYGFLRNAIFNARNFFATQPDQLKRGQFGATMGGPIIKNRTFFFGEYQGTRITDSVGGLSAFVPTQADLAGNFSAFLSASNPNNPQGKAVQIKDPTNGMPFPNNQIPVGRFDPAALKVSALFPQASGNGLVFFNKPDVEKFDEAMGRVDHMISNSDRVFVRYFWLRYQFDPVLVPNNLLTYTSGSHIPYDNSEVRENHIFRPNLLNDFRFSYIRQNGTRGPASNAPDPADLGVQGMWLPAQKSIEGIAATGFFSFGDYTVANFVRNNFAWSDDVRWVLGRHNLSFGGAFERDRFDSINELNEHGNFTFSGDTTGSALTDFMLGRMRTFLQGNGRTVHERFVLFSLYAQDSFHASSRLTLNFGLRWEPSLPPSDLFNQELNFYPGAYAAGIRSKVFLNAPPGELFPGDPGFPKNGAKGDWTAIAPRFGFAYDVFGNGKTSLRGGAGIFYDSRINDLYNNNMLSQNPYSSSVNLTTPKGPFSNPYLGITNPFPTPQLASSTSPFPAPVTVVAYDPSGQFTAPTIYNWNLVVERQLIQDWLARIAYVGTRSTHISKDVQLNPAVYIPGSTLSTTQRRLFQGYANIEQNSAAVNASYHSLQLTLEKRLSHGLTILANYTFSKSLDDEALNKNGSEFGQNSYGALPWYFPNSESLDRGPSDFDHTHSFVVSAVWQPKIPGGVNPWIKGVFGNWAIGGIGTAQSGDPLTVMTNLDESQTGLGRDHANYVGGPLLGPGACQNIAPCVNYINPTAFALPGIGTFGDTGKGIIRGPGLLNFDLNFSKNIPITERWRLQFRAEFFNIFNHANFLDPGSASSTAGSSAGYASSNGVNMSAGGFGSIRAAYDPRITQLALKIIF